jgi:hypothetical protein
MVVWEQEPWVGKAQIVRMGWPSQIGALDEVIVEVRSAAGVQQLWDVVAGRRGWDRWGWKTPSIVEPVMLKVRTDKSTFSSVEASSTYLNDSALQVDNSVGTVAIVPVNSDRSPVVPS